MPTQYRVPDAGKLICRLLHWSCRKQLPGHYARYYAQLLPGFALIRRNTYFAFFAGRGRHLASHPETYQYLDCTEQSFIL
jgi:hypothetical protein